MMNLYLPYSLTIDGEEYAIRSNWQAIVESLGALQDVELTKEERIYVMLNILYIKMPNNIEEAVNQAIWFISAGQNTPKRKTPHLVDWEQDINFILSPITKALGRDPRADTNMHWWTFLSLYTDMGECLFTKIVAIRSQLAMGKPLSKEDRAFYNQHRDICDIKQRYTTAEQELLEKWGVK